ncbi:MAG: hypothetical protein H0X33_01015 [Taibaiella sp.]|nr:hypothetical protein [Taibaiella sp.]
MLRKFIVLIACVLMLSPAITFGQEGQLSPEGRDVMHAMEDSLVLTADSMYHAFIPDERQEYSQRFIKQLVKALKTPFSYTYSFDKLKDVINIIGPDDNSFRILNWNISTTPVTRRYYGAIQMPGEQLKLYPLVDYTNELGRTVADSALANGKWFGALYYKILTHDAGGQKVYTLFGLNAASAISNKKVMDPLTFTEHGPVFGAQIFNVTSENVPGQKVYRFILEYKKEVQVSMNWDDELKCVFFDKLVSQVNDPNRKYTYVPSGQYDGFKWEEEQWKYIKDLIPIQELGDGNAPSGGKEFISK